MQGSRRSVELKRKHVEFLNSAGFLNEGLLAQFQNIEWVSPNRAVLELDPSVVQQFVDMLSDQLMVVGFDVNYELTVEGRMIEDLIDVFLNF